jgi:hypothetical protein
MVKYHINPATGEAGKCSATKGPCPFGNEEEHFSSLAEAKLESEKRLESIHGDASLKKNEQETAKVALRKNTTVRNVLKKLPREARQAITGGYLDLAPHIELSAEYVKTIDDFSKESDRQHTQLTATLAKLELKKRDDQSSSEALMATAALQKEDGFKNEYVLAAALSQYEDIEVYFPTGNIDSGGKPKVDMVVSIKGEQYPLSIKKTNGTQIETYTSRATVSEIMPGAKVTEAIEETSNRIFFFRPKFQAFATKPEEKEKLRLLKDGSPKLAGASVRIEYGHSGKIPADRPTLPEESAVSAFGGVSQNAPMEIHDYKNDSVGTIANSSARLLVVGDFSKISDLSQAPTPKEILGGGMPISRKGLRERGLSVMLRVSSMGNRTGDWVTDKSHITDKPGLTLSSYRAALKRATA